MSTISVTHARQQAPEHWLVAAERANQWTHGAGFVLSMVGAAALWAKLSTNFDLWRGAGVMIYAASLVALYAASTLSHSFLFKSKQRHFWRMVDQVCIFFLIAGTFTPFGLVYMREGWTWYITLAMWGVALVGATFKVCYRYGTTVCSSAYVLMGWLPVTTAGVAMARVPHAALSWLLIGGLLYTAGILFLANDHRHQYFHATWHMMVVTASLCHFIAIYAYVA
jgi:hemolysin III